MRQAVINVFENAYSNYITQGIGAVAVRRTDQIDRVDIALSVSTDHGESGAWTSLEDFRHPFTDRGGTL